MKRALLLTTMALAGLCPLPAPAAPAFAPVLQSHMVLQRGAPVTLWGTADAGEMVTVEWKGQRATAEAAEGQWKVVFPACAADATGSTITATDSTGSASLCDVLVGDLWLASGQSNMEWRIRQTVTVPAGIRTDNPQVRLLNGRGYLRYDSPKPYSEEYYREARAGRGYEWQCQVCSAESIRDFSAVGTYFALRLQEAQQVPIGVICNAVGGSPMEAWMPRSLIESNPRYENMRGNKWLDSPNHDRWISRRGRQNLAPMLARGEENLLHPYAPGYLYGVAVEPLANLALRGVIWYQGEANAETPDIAHNAAMLQDLIGSWRRTFRNEELPFLMVQLTRYNYPNFRYWPEFREAQMQAARALPQVGLICSIDLSSAKDDIHPRVKAPFGHRLADLARSMVYGEQGLPTYPTATSWAAEGNSLTITFDQELRTTDGAPPRGFAVGNPAQWESFEEVPARLCGKSVTLTLPRNWEAGMAWRYIHKIFAEPNLVGAEGELPAFPARSEYTPLEP